MCIYIYICIYIHREGERERERKRERETYINDNITSSNKHRINDLRSASKQDQRAARGELQEHIDINNTS